MALVYRAHFALIRSPIYTSDRRNTSATFGFLNTLLDLMEKQKPTHLAVAFDTSDPTPRHEWYPEYKAGRDEMPEDLASNIEPVKRLCRAFNIPVLVYPGFEADDVIGTLAKKAAADGDTEVFMVTPDKDFAQLVDEHISIYKPGRQGSEPEILDEATICANWEIERPDQVVDILGLWGDASDNIPGIPGIGEKTAKKLIKQFGDVETLLDSSDQLKGKQKENVINFREQGLLSKKLARIIVDAPVELDFDALEINDRNDEDLQQFFVEFEFNAVGKRLYGKDFEAGRGFAKKADGEAELKTIADVPHDYRWVKSTDAKGRAEILAEYAELGSFCFDIETDSLDHRLANILGIALSHDAHRGVYVELPKDAIEAKAMIEEFRPILENSESEKIGHNLKFDVSVLFWNGIQTRGALFDTMLAHSLVEPEQRHKMDYLAERYLGYTPIKYDDVFGAAAEKSGQMTMFDAIDDEGGADPEKIAEYAAEDADVTWQLAAIMREELSKLDQDNVFYEIESPLLPVLVAMESEGIKVDTNTLSEIGEILGKRIGELEKEVYQSAGEEFNLNSPKQLGEILFDKLKLVEKPKKTATGQYKTDEQTLSSLAGTHPLIAQIMEYREASKLKGTYVDTLPEAIFGGTGRVHTTFLQLMTATGRLASNNPNLQNIPIRTEMGREIRRAFVPRSDEYTLMAADYSQIELRVMASLSGDPAMMEAFSTGLDIHTATAARVNGLSDPAEVTSEMRRTAKMVNFGIIYGISAFGLSQRLGTVSRSEAAAIIEEYFRQYPRVKEFMDNTIEQAKEDGYVETVGGRRRYLRDINSRSWSVRGAAERTAINTPIQGTAADMIKIAMIEVDRLLRDGGYKTTMLLQVHDELVFDLHKDEAEEVTPKIVEAMVNALKLDVPVVVETGAGDNWLDAH